MRYYHLEAQPYGGGRSRSIGTVNQAVAVGSIEALYAATTDELPVLDGLAVGSCLHCGVPRRGSHSGGLLTITRTR